VGRTFFAEQIEQLVADARYARQDDAVAPDDRWPRGVMRAEKLVGGVDEMKLHDSGQRIRVCHIATPASRIA